VTAGAKKSMMRDIRCQPATCKSARPSTVEAV